MVVIITIKDLSVKTLKGRVLIDNFSLVLNDDDKIAIIGEEGNGKSTLLKIINQDKSLNEYVTYDGEIAINEDVIGYLPQRIDVNWLEKHLSDYFIKQEPDDKTSDYDTLKWSRMLEIAAKFRLDKRLIKEDHCLKTLSGGELIKIQLIKIMIDEPDVLLLDEPTNDLDIKALYFLEQFMLTQKIPIIFVSHDEMLLKKVANGIIHIEQLKKKQEAKCSFLPISYQEYLDYRNQKLIKDTMIARKEKAEYDIKKDKWQRLYQSVDYNLNAVSRQDPHQAKMLKRKMTAVKAQKRKLDAIDLPKIPDPEEAINLFFPSVNLPKQKIILDLNVPTLTINDRVLANDINLFIRGNSKVMIIGDNGVGKTTLLNLIYQKLIQNNIRVGYMRQNYIDEKDEDLSCLQYLGVDKNKQEATLVRKYLGNLKFTFDETEQAVRDLSGGQRAKLILLDLVYHAYPVILMDEPTRNLSPLTNPVIQKMIKQYQGCVIAISHDRSFIDAIADKVYELRSDGLVEVNAD